MTIDIYIMVIYSEISFISAIHTIHSYTLGYYILMGDKLTILL